MRARELKLEIVSGVEGPSVYLEGYRIAGPKPWGGGKITHTFRLTTSDIRIALAFAASAHRAEVRREWKAAAKPAKR